MTTTAHGTDPSAPAGLEYRAGLDLAGPAREGALELMARLLDLHTGRTTDQAPALWAEPVENYRDDALFAAELELYRRIPLPLALSCELPKPGSYKAIEAAGVPVLLSRAADGAVHALLNICRHRGAELCEAGTGTARAFVCKYHAWSYGLDGQLKGVASASTFGPVEPAGRGLIALPVEERHGIVFVGLTPGGTLDLDGWLGEMDGVLAELRLQELYAFSARMMPGPNWKVTVDGYLEGYHFASLHRNTVYKTNLGNLSAFDSFGPHARIAFGLRPLPDAVGTPRDEWRPADCVGPIVWVFPGLAIAGGWRDRMSVSLPILTTSRTETVTDQRIMMRRPPSTEHELHEAEFTRDWFYDVVYNEDYLTGFGVQRGVRALPAGDTQLFGRNEIGVQHFHRELNRLMAVHLGPEHPQPRVAD